MSLGEDLVTRVDCAGIKAQVESLQHAALVTWQLRSKRQLPDGQDNLNIQLHRPGEDSPRYTIHIADKPPSSKPNAYKFAAFVIPQGR